MTLKIPKYNKLRVISKNLIPTNLAGSTDLRFYEVTGAVAGTQSAVVRFYSTTFAAADPTDGSRFQLTLAIS